MAQERLQKVLAAAGVGARRECEEIILDARVSVNGQVVSSLPVLVDPERDEIAVDGRPLRTQRKVYFLLHKPEGVHCTNYDPEGRVLARDLLRGVHERVFPVGRLDASSSGLLLMTNDGELAERLTHPRYGVPKTYRADVKGQITQADIESLRRGIYLPEGKAQISQGRIVHSSPEATIVEVTLREGRNREVRSVLARLGHKVRKLTRIKIGPLSLRGLGPSAFRPLTNAELKALQQYTREDHADRPASRPRETPASKRPTFKDKRSDRQIDHRMGKKSDRSRSRDRREN